MPNDPLPTAPPTDLGARAKPLRRHLPLASTPPDLVPARMINEALYCERLLYLEWAQGEFADNAFTVEGRVAHKRVNGHRKLTHLGHEELTHPRRSGGGSRLTS